jgi:SDR family mycofactocin-dependent oxidoreductase
VGLLEGRTALITGAARGQGRAHALRMATEGASIIAVDIAEDISELKYSLGTEEELAETVRAVEAAGGRAIAVKADVRSQGQLDEAVATGLDRFGGIDICVANAGVVAHGDFWTLTEEEWGQVLDVDLMGVWRTAKAVAPHMIDRRFGSIVITVSINGLEAAPGVAHYTAAKHGALGLMRAIALELAPYGVRCNAICPAATDTGMLDNQFMLDQFAGKPGGTRADLERAVPHYHALAPTSVIQPDAIANAALWLASDMADRVTGIHVPVDAGHLLLPGYNHNPVL